MDEIDVVPRPSDPVDNIKSACLLTLRIVSGEDVGLQRSNYKMGRSSGKIKSVRFFLRITGIDGEAIEFEWNILTGFTSLQILQKIQGNFARTEH